MASVVDAQDILAALGLPVAQRNEISALTLLALAGLGPDDAWSKSSRQPLTVTKGIMALIATRFGREYAPNTRETVRRRVLHQFVQAAVAEYNPFEPNLPTNSPRTHYALSPAALTALRAYGSAGWPAAAATFVREKGSLAEAYAGRRRLHTVPVRLPGGEVVRLSPGHHNRLEKAVVEEMASRFFPASELLYLGETAGKARYMNLAGLQAAGISLSEHDLLPDIVFRDTNRNWLIFVEAVSSHGPMSPKRVAELNQLSKSAECPLVHVTAFLDFTQFRRHASDIAWETEVWIAEAPDHLIHFDGEQFITVR